MKDQNTTQVRVTEGSSGLSSNNELHESRKEQLEKLKKPLIYFLMTVVCAGCLYLIFKPKKKAILEDVGFNSAIPQAAEDKLQSDKQKAYEQQLLEQKNEEKKNALTTLSDYWTDPVTSQNGNSQNVNDQSQGNQSGILSGDQNAVNSYRNAQQTLGSFYSRDDQEVRQLKREINRLKDESSQKDTAPVGTSINDQLELMEKSYQMAAKYLPTNAGSEKSEEKKVLEKQNEQKKVQVTVAQPVRKNLVSTLYRESKESFVKDNMITILSDLGLSYNEATFYKDAEKLSKNLSVTDKKKLVVPMLYFIGEDLRKLCPEAEWSFNTRRYFQPFDEPILFYQDRYFTFYYINVLLENKLINEKKMTFRSIYQKVEKYYLKESWFWEKH